MNRNCLFVSFCYAKTAIKSHEILTSMRKISLKLSIVNARDLIAALVVQHIVK